VRLILKKGIITKTASNQTISTNDGRKHMTFVSFAVNTAAETQYSEHDSNWT